MLGVIAAILLQRQQNQLQARELRLQRKELELTRKELEGQKEALDAQTAQLRWTSETGLMQQLMNEYDNLRESIRTVTDWMDREGAPATSVIRAAVNHRGTIDDQTFNRYRPALDANEHRYVISRFFVKIRKLSDAGYIADSLVVFSLDRRAVEFFLSYIDPLDEAVAGSLYRDRDREYFKYLLEHKYPTEIGLPRLDSASTVGFTGHAPTPSVGPSSTEEPA
jgi:hypothetical protein